MSIYKRDDSKFWWMSFTVNGKEVRRSTKATNKKTAEKIYHKVMTQIAEGQYFKNAVGANKTLQHMIDKYMTEYSICKSPSGHSRDKISAKHLLDFFGNPRIKEVTAPLIVNYKVFRRNEGMAPATIERELCLLKRAFNLAKKEWKWTEENPVLEVSRERFNNQRDRWLSFEEEEMMLDVCSEWLEEITIFALSTGMRRSEILDLEWPYVSVERRTATIMKSKNGERRTIPLNKRALEILKKKAKVRYLKSSFVFPSKVGTRIGNRNLSRAFSDAVQKAGIENFTFHDLRHTFATLLVQNGVDLYTVGNLLGHKDIRMTQRYSHHCTESLRGGVEVLDNLLTNFSRFDDENLLETG